MAKQGTHNYENLLEADLWEVFGDDIMNKALEFNKGIDKACCKKFNTSLKYLLEAKKDKLLTALILHGILDHIYKFKNEKLDEAMEKQGIFDYIRCS